MMESSVSSVSSVPPDFEPITKTIRKRDGVTIQSFEVEKIRRAVSKAWLSEYPEINSMQIEKVIRLVVTSIENVEVTVEDVQDLVELALMKIAPKVAKHYIIYREERAKKRALVSRKSDPKAVSDYIHAGKYAKYRADLGRAGGRRRRNGLREPQFPRDLGLCPVCPGSALRYKPFRVGRRTGRTRQRSRGAHSLGGGAGSVAASCGRGGIVCRVHGNDGAQVGFLSGLARRPVLQHVWHSGCGKGKVLRLADCGPEDACVLASHDFDEAGVARATGLGAQRGADKAADPAGHGERGRRL